jgi:hypothetical protein
MFQMRRAMVFRRGGLFLAGIVAATVWVGQVFWQPGVEAAELVMFDRAGCAWCLRWEKEIGPIYPKTEEGRRLPLRQVSLDRPLPADLALATPVRYTPTFVILDEGQEIGRITGYIGEYAFWGLLSEMVAKLPATGAASNRPQPQAK